MTVDGVLDPLYIGPPTLEEMPGRFHVALAGMGFIIESKDFRRHFIEDMRPVADNYSEASEAIFNPVTAWRRGQYSWDEGVGARNFDQDPAPWGQVKIRRRMRSSLGVNPWELDELSVLPGLADTYPTDAVGVATMAAVATASGTYLAINDTVVLSPNIGTAGVAVGDVVATTCTMPAAFGNVTHLVVAGSRVFARGSDAGHLAFVTAGATTFAETGLTGRSGVGFGAGRLLTWANGVLSEAVVDATTGVWSLDQIVDRGLAGFKWQGVADSPSGVYVWGAAEHGSEVYRTVTADDGSLGVPVYALGLPQGEVLNHVLYFQQSCILSTSLGFRVADASATNGLQFGPLIEIAGGVRWSFADGRWVYFDWSSFDPITFPRPAAGGNPRYQGLGRINLATMLTPLAPAYAPDVMLVSSQPCAGVIYDGAGTIILVDSHGVGHRRDATVAPDFTPRFFTGRIRYGAFDPKYFSSVNVGSDPLTGGATVSVIAHFDDGSTVEVGAYRAAGNAPLAIGHVGEWCELEFQLTPSSSAPTLSPVLTRWTLHSLPNPRKAEEFVVPIILFPEVDTGDNQFLRYDVAAVKARLRSLCSAQSPVEFQIGVETMTVFVSNMEEAPQDHRLARSADLFGGVVTLALRTLV